MSIYLKIKELARLKNISVRELEHQLGFSNGTLNKWNNTAPSDKLETVANFFNVTVDYLLGRTSDLTDNNNDLKNFLDKNLHHGMFYGGGPTTREQEKQLEVALKAIYHEYYEKGAD